MAYSQSPMNITANDIDAILINMQQAVQEGYVLTGPLTELKNVDGTSHSLFVITMERKAVAQPTEASAKDVVVADAHKLEGSLSQGSAETANTTQEANSVAQEGTVA